MEQSKSGASITAAIAAMGAVMIGSDLFARSLNNFSTTMRRATAGRNDRVDPLPYVELPKGKRAMRRARGKAKAMRRDVADYWQGRNL